MAMPATLVTLLASVAMIFFQANAALMVLGYKFLVTRGVTMVVIVAYRLSLATLVLCLSTFLGERYIRKPTPQETQNLQMSWMVMLLAFLCGLFGGSLGSNLYVASLHSTSTTTATAISNLSPAVTFILAVIFRRENLGINTWGGRAKIVGTLIVIGGAMTLSFYKGSVLRIWGTSPRAHVHRPLGKGLEPPHNSEVVGLLLALATSVASSLSIIIQDLLLERYPSQMRSTALIVGMGAVQSLLYAVAIDRDINHWKLDFSSLSAILVYAAVVASGLGMVLVSWCISRKGSFFVSIFSPITLTAVAILSPLLLGEELHIGSAIGSVVIFCGIYLVIWGKTKDQKEPVEEVQQEVELEAAPDPAPTPVLVPAPAPSPVPEPAPASGSVPALDPVPASAPTPDQAPAQEQQHQPPSDNEIIEIG